MAASSGDTWRSNPFPLAPVARLGPPADLGAAPVQPADSGNVTIATPVLAELTGLVEDYLRPPPPGGRRGRAVALVGEFGLGKSHVLREVCNSLAEQQPAAPALWIVDEPVRDFGRMYRDRLHGPADTAQGRTAFEELVKDYYAYVTAVRVSREGAEPRSGRLDEIAAGLRDRSLDPDKVVSALRYDVEVIHADLRGTLGSVTEHRRFATALSLMRDRRFSAMVWDWLTGEEPAAPLRERGIREPVSGIDPVFDALAVQGFLHGRVGSPYVLLLDSLEKVLEWPEDSRRTFVDAFERLVNVYVSRGGLLVFCTSPAGLDEFRPSLHERVVQLWPTGLDERLGADLVAEYVHAGPRPDPLGSPGAAERWPAPFGAETVRVVQELTGGVPREILKTCRQAWQDSEDAAGRVREVTSAAVLTAVRTLHEKVSREQVLTAVHEALDLGQWRLASSDPVHPAAFGGGSGPPDGQPEVVHWIEVAQNAYLAVMLSRSVLVADDEERIAERVRALHVALNPARAEVLLVVNGAVPRSMRDRLARAIGSQPLVYRPRSFAGAVNRALERLAARLTELRHEAGLADLAVELRSALSEQAAHMVELRHDVTEAVRSVPVAGAEGVSVEPRPLPGPVEARFEEVLALLDDVLDRLSGTSSGTGEPRVGRRPVTRADLGTLGCATLVGTLTREFRRGVADWCATALPALRTAARAPAAEEGWAVLRGVCRSYETAVEVLPLEELDAAGPPRRTTAARAVEALADDVWGALVGAVTDR